MLLKIDVDAARNFARAAGVLRGFEHLPEQQFELNLSRDLHSQIEVRRSRSKSRRIFGHQARQMRA